MQKCTEYTVQGAAKKYNSRTPAAEKQPDRSETAGEKKTLFLLKSNLSASVRSYQ